MTKSNHSRTLPIVAADHDASQRRFARCGPAQCSIGGHSYCLFLTSLFSTDVPHMTAQPVILQAEPPTSEAFCDRGIARPTLVGTPTEGRSLFKQGTFGPGSPGQNASPRLALGLIRRGGQATAAWGGALPFVPADVIVRSGVQFPHSRQSGIGQHLPFGRLPECPRRIASGGSGQRPGYCCFGW